MKHDRIMKTRQRLARHVERAALPERPFIGPGPRHRPAERYRCVRSSLREIAGVLRDEAHLIDEESLEAVKRFLTDGASSPYFGRDSTGSSPGGCPPSARRRRGDARFRRGAARRRRLTDHQEEEEKTSSPARSLIRLRVTLPP